MNRIETHNRHLSIFGSCTVMTIWKLYYPTTKSSTTSNVSPAMKADPYGNIDVSSVITIHHPDTLAKMAANMTSR